jgi:HEAT repeat protein
MLAFIPFAGLPVQHYGPLVSNCSPSTMRGGHHIAQTGRRSKVPRFVCCASEEVPALEAEVRSLLQSPEKAKQQRGLLMVRQLPPAVALELLILSVRTSKNEWIRGSATVALGQLSDADAATVTRAIQSLLDILGNDSDYSVRAAAAAGCGYLAENSAVDMTDVVEQLIRCSDEDVEWQVQFSCVVSLGNIGDRKAVPVLHRALKSDNALIVQGAVGAIGEIADPASVAPLLSCLASDDEITRQRLAQAFGSFSPDNLEPAIVDALRTLSQDSSFLVREAAKSSLSRYGIDAPSADDEQSGVQVVDAKAMASDFLSGKTSNNQDSLSESPAMDTFRRLLQRSFDKESASPGEGAFMTGPGFRGSPGESSDVVSATSEPSSEGEQVSPRLSSEARGRGGTASNSAEYERLVEVLRTGTLTTRSVALIGLRALPVQQAWEAIMETKVLSDPSERIRSLAVPLLARAKDIRALENILLEDSDQSVRAGACDGLVEAGGGLAAVRACLKAFESDPHWLVRISAAISLGVIGSEYQIAEDALLASLEAGGVKNLGPPEDAVVRRYAVSALGALGVLRALPTFRAMLESPACDEFLRFSIAGALRDMPSPDSVAIARMLVGDESPPVRELAAGSLSALESQGFY